MYKFNQLISLHLSIYMIDPFQLRNYQINSPNFILSHKKDKISENYLIKLFILKLIKNINCIV